VRLQTSSPADGDALIDTEPYIDEAPQSREAAYAIALGAFPWLMCALAVALAATSHVIHPVAAGVGWTLGLFAGLAGGLWGTRLRGRGATAAAMLGLWAPYVTFTPTVLAVVLTNEWLF